MPHILFVQTFAFSTGTNVAFA